MLACISNDTIRINIRPELALTRLIVMHCQVRLLAAGWADLRTEDHILTPF